MVTLKSNKVSKYGFPISNCNSKRPVKDLMERRLSKVPSLIHIADKNGAVLDILSKHPSGHSHSQLHLQIYIEKMVLTKQTCVLLSRRACVELMAVARFFTTEYEISGQVVSVCRI